MINSTSTYPMAEGQTKHAPPLSLWRISGGLAFVSGHGCVDSEGKFPFQDFEAQYRFTMEQLKATLHEIGVTFSDVVNVRCYVQNASDIPCHNTLYREYFCEPFPARTTIVNCLPPGLLFEIECVATAPQELL